jgi:trk system potassium uptake protein TrkA
MRCSTCRPASPGCARSITPTIPQLFDDNNFAVDFSICPEQIVTDYIVKLIEFPEALQVLEFADGLVSLVAVRAFEGGPLVGRPLKDIRKHMPQVDARIAAIFRRDTPITPEGDTVIEAGDEVFCLAATEGHPPVMRELRRMDKAVKRIMIAGGGNIGHRLVRAIEGDYQVKVIDRNKRHAEWLAENVRNALVLQGDATDEKLLDAENIDEMDLFLALTNDDENNIMSALLAKRMGAKRVAALINRAPTPTWCRAARSTSPFRRRRPPSAPCSPTCGAATWRRCTACAAAPPRRSNWWCTATKSPPRWSAGASRSCR